MYAEFRSDQIASARSPLTGTNDVVLVGTFDVQSLRRKWQERLGIDVGEELPPDGDITLFACNKSGLRFFHPPALAGSPQIYEKLQSIEWYYNAERWDFRCALGDLSAERAVLEIGCGPGEFLSHLKRQTLEAIGIDTNPNAVREARSRGVNAIEVPLAQFAEQNLERFDAICAFQVLEHVSDPLGFVSTCLKLIKKGGRLIFSVPNSDGYLKYDDEILDLPPHHMTRWNIESFRFLQTILPIKLVKVRLQPLSVGEIDKYCRAKQRAWGSEQGWLARRLPSSVARYALYRLLQTGFFKLCAGHSLYVILRKIRGSGDAQ